MRCPGSLANSLTPSLSIFIETLLTLGTLLPWPFLKHTCTHAVPSAWHPLPSSTHVTHSCTVSSLCSICHFVCEVFVLHPFNKSNSYSFLALLMPLPLLSFSPSTQKHTPDLLGHNFSLNSELCDLQDTLFLRMYGPKGSQRAGRDSRVWGDRDRGEGTTLHLPVPCTVVDTSQAHNKCFLRDWMTDILHLFRISVLLQDYLSNLTYFIMGLEYKSL